MSSGMARHVQAHPITAEAFSSFGELLTIPEGADRLDQAATLWNGRADARLNLALVRPPLASLPMTVSLMERHRFSTQAFLPLEGRAYLLLVAPAAELAPDPAQLQAFLVPGHIGICYHRAIWHMGMTTLEAAGTMAMLVHQNGSDEDTDYLDIETVRISLA